MRSRRKGNSTVQGLSSTRQSFEYGRSTISAIWPEFIEALRSIAITVAVLSVASLLLIVSIAVLIEPNGNTLWDVTARMLPNLPELLGIKLLIGAAFICVFGAIVFVFLLMTECGRTISIEGHDFTFLIVMTLAATLVMVAVMTAGGKWSELPLVFTFSVGIVAPFMWPLYVMGRHRRRQDRILDKIRAQFVLATTSLMADERTSALHRLRTIRNLESQWRLGASFPIRFALLTYVLATNMAIAFVGRVLGLHFNSNPRAESVLDTWHQVWTSPWLLAMIIGMAILFGLASFRDASQIQSRPWSEFYGDFLEKALHAGRNLAAAGEKARPRIRKNVSARDLLGLSERFTKAELRRAWLRLARELQPDRWTSATPAVRRRNEAAMKRVNAARDELIPQAV